MSELLEASPSLAHLDAEQSALETRDDLPDINFDDIADALQFIDPILQQTDYDHYMQEVRITGLYLEKLATAKNLFEAKEYGACRIAFNVILDLVRPTNNLYLITMLNEAHDKLYR